MFFLEIAPFQDKKPSERDAFLRIAQKERCPQAEQTNNKRRKFAETKVKQQNSKRIQQLVIELIAAHSKIVKR